MAHILIVDDEPEIRCTVRRILERRDHTIDEAADLAGARAQLAVSNFDLVLCDINLSGESGLELVRQVAEDLPDIAVVMLTGIDDPLIAEESLAMGACGYLVKPFRPNELVINVASGLRVRDLERARRSTVDELEAKVLGRTTALRDAVNNLEKTEVTADAAVQETADRLVTALTLRSEETGGHIRRMSGYGARLAGLAGVDDWSRDEIRGAMMLHDVGKIGVLDSILLKPGALTDDEYDIIKRHPAMGAELLADGHSRVLVLGAEIALTHHERWDGAGYPRGLAGESIPVIGRVAAIADVFDALTSDRVYRMALPVDQAVEMMVDERDSHFDPELLDLFTARLDDMLAIRAANAEPPPSTSEITVVVIEGRPMFAEALVRLLAQADGITVVGVCSTSAAATNLVSERQPTVIVVDAELSQGESSVEALRMRAPNAAVIVMSRRDDDDLVLRTLDSGGAGVVQRDRVFEELVPAVCAAAIGQPLLAPAKLMALFSRRREHAHGVRSDLTERELDVIRLMTDGLSNQAIATHLHLSLNTIRNHAQRILTKLGVHSKLEAVAMAGRKGLLPSRDQPLN